MRRYPDLRKRRRIVTNDETYAGNGGDGLCNVIIGADSQWFVTGDSRISNLSSSGSITDETGETVTIQGTDGTVYVEGGSEYVITVDSYRDSADLSGAASADNWEMYEAEWPEA